ncbi:MAG: hypothetical protein MHM6MM_002953 [Cercozoa sp. M6MM]
MEQPLLAVEAGAHAFPADGSGSLQQQTIVTRFRADDDDDFTWDYCLVLAVGDEENLFEECTQTMLEQLKLAGLHTKVVRGEGKDEDKRFVLIGASDTRLRQEADRLNFDLLLDSEAVKEKLRVLDSQLELRAREALVEDSERYVELRKYQNGLFEYLHASYDSEPARHNLFKKFNEDADKHANSPFDEMVRLKLTNSIVQGERIHGNAGLTVSRLAKKKKSPLLAFFPLHSPTALAETREGTKIWPTFVASVKHPLTPNLNLDHFRRYLGENWALYFGFLLHYSVWLMLPAAVGSIFFVMQLVSGKVDVGGVFVLGGIIVLWAATMGEFWSRLCARYNARWGQLNFKSKEQARAEFYGDWRYSAINGRLQEEFSWKQRLPRQVFSLTSVAVLLMMCVSCVVGIFTLRARPWWQTQRGGALVGVISAVNIQVWNFLYGKIMPKLNNWENHRTESAHANSLILKTFLFKFVNNYNTLFYLAFFKRWHVGCADGSSDDDAVGCLPELQMQLGTMFASIVLMNNAMEIGLPWLQGKLCGRKLESANPMQQQFRMPVQESPSKEYDEIVTQFGFVSLFVVAFPVAPLLALLNNGVELWLDRHKATVLMRRATPQGAADIGRWQSLLSTLSYISVLTNVGISIFGTRQVDQWLKVYLPSRTERRVAKAWLFIREEYVASLVMNDVADETDDDVVAVLTSADTAALERSSSIHVDDITTAVTGLVIAEEPLDADTDSHLPR